LNGPRTTMRDIERILLEVGAVTENDVRLKRKESDEEINSNQNAGGDDNDEDDDWE